MKLLVLYYSINEVENEIMQIPDEISELKSPDDINSEKFEEAADTENEEILKKEVLLMIMKFMIVNMKTTHFILIRYDDYFKF